MQTCRTRLAADPAGTRADCCALRPPRGLDARPRQCMAPPGPRSSWTSPATPSQWVAMHTSPHPPLVWGWRVAFRNVLHLLCGSPSSSDDGREATVAAVRDRCLLLLLTIRILYDTTTDLTPSNETVAAASPHEPSRPSRVLSLIARPPVSSSARRLRGPRPAGWIGIFFCVCARWIGK